MATKLRFLTEVIEMKLVLLDYSLLLKNDGRPVRERQSHESLGHS